MQIIKKVSGYNTFSVTCYSPNSYIAEAQIEHFGWEQSSIVDNDKQTHKQFWLG